MGYVWIVLYIVVKYGLGVWQYYKREKFRNEEKNKQENVWLSCKYTVTRINGLIRNKSNIKISELS